MSDTNRRFPMCDSQESITWAQAEQIYAEYSSQFTGQTLERIAARGGFGVREAISLLCARIERLEWGPGYEGMKQQLNNAPISQLPALLAHVAGLCASKPVFRDKIAAMAFVERAFDAGQKELAGSAEKK